MSVVNTNKCCSRGVRASKRGLSSSSAGESSVTCAEPAQDADSHCHAAERRKSLNSKRTLQLLNRATTTRKLRAAAPLWSFKKKNKHPEQPSPTIAAASREQAVRLYAGPTVRAAGSWEARYDSPGPQAYNEGLKWRDKFRNVPSTRIDVAECERHMALPTKPGPGDYNIAHHSIGENGNAVKFGDPKQGKRYPPRTPDLPRAEVPCSYAEPEHVSCLRYPQVISDRATSPAVFFGGAPRFQESSNTRKLSLERTSGTTKTQQRSLQKKTKASRSTGSAIRPQAPATAAAGSRRVKKRRKRRRGGPRIFRRGDYDWLTSCAEPKPWEPRLKLLGDCEGRASGDRSLSTDPSRSRALTERNAPRPVLRRGQRHNQSEYNPQRRDLPREKDRYPGPKYDPPPGAFGRTSGGGGSKAPSASISSLDRFPLGRLFPEEEVREREATPGPEAYDVGLDHRLETHSLEKMQGSLETLASWGSLGVVEPEGWLVTGGSGRGGALSGDLDRGSGADGGQCDGGVRAAVESAEKEKRTRPSHVVSEDPDNTDEIRRENEEEGCGEQPQSAPDLLESVAKRTLFGRSLSPCFAGAGSPAARQARTRSPNRTPLPSSTTSTQSSRQRHHHHHHHGGTRHCSRLFPASSVAAWSGVPCPACFGSEVAFTAGSLVAAASSLSDANLFRRARTTGASVSFGDMPRQRSAPAFSIGRGARDATSRLLHTTPGETIYRENRIGRSGVGPATACPRAGDSLTKPRPPAAIVILPRKIAGASGTGVPRGSSEAVAGVEGVAERDSVAIDGALGDQVKSCRPTSPSFTLAGPRRAATLFHERLRYDGKELTPEQRDQSQPRTFFDAHVSKARETED